MRDRFSRRLLSVSVAGALALGGGAVALAAQGGPPQDLPEVSRVPDDPGAQGHAGQDPEGEEPEGEEPEVEGPEDAGNAFSAWVEGLELTGCQRGRTVAANAKGPKHDFDPAQATEVAPEDLPGNCWHEATSEASTADQPTEAQEGDGPEAGAPHDAGPPDHAPAHGRRDR